MTSTSTGKRYDVRRIGQEWSLARSSFYASRKRACSPSLTAPRRRGPKPAIDDECLTKAIRADLAASPFVGEGHRKVWARLRAAGTRTSKARVLRLMRDAKLLAPYRAGRVLGPSAHDGTIITTRPNEMWGTDATTVLTTREGSATVFIAVDHCTAECVGIHAAKRGTRFEALEPLRQGIRTHFGGFGPDVAAGLKVRHDHGSQFMSEVFQDEVRFLGALSSPAFVRAPEGNGCSERFIRTLKEHLLWVRHFETVEELRRALVAWAAVYNEAWLIGRHGHRSPKARRNDFIASQLAA